MTRGLTGCLSPLSACPSAEQLGALRSTHYRGNPFGPGEVAVNGLFDASGGRGRVGLCGEHGRGWAWRGERRKQRLRASLSLTRALGTDGTSACHGPVRSAEHENL